MSKAFFYSASHHLWTDFALCNVGIEDALGNNIMELKRGTSIIPRWAETVVITGGKKGDYEKLVDWTTPAREFISRLPLLKKLTLKDWPITEKDRDRWLDGDSSTRQSSVHMTGTPFIKHNKHTSLWGSFLAFTLLQSLHLSLNTSLLSTEEVQKEISWTLGRVLTQSSTLEHMHIRAADRYFQFGPHLVIAILAARLAHCQTYMARMRKMPDDTYKLKLRLRSLCLRNGILSARAGQENPFDSIARLADTSRLERLFIDGPSPEIAAAQFAPLRAVNFPALQVLHVGRLFLLPDYETRWNQIDPGLIERVFLDFDAPVYSCQVLPNCTLSHWPNGSLGLFNAKDAGWNHNLPLRPRGVHLPMLIPRMLVNADLVGLHATKHIRLDIALGAVDWRLNSTYDWPPALSDKLCELRALENLWLRVYRAQCGGETRDHTIAWLVGRLVRACPALRTLDVTFADRIESTDTPAVAAAVGPGWRAILYPVTLSDEHRVVRRGRGVVLARMNVETTYIVKTDTLGFPIDML